MTQLELPLGGGDGVDDQFVIGTSNARVVNAIEHWGSWPVMCAMLTGPRKSGRSTLARLFHAKSGGTVFDDAETRDETEMFHAWNRAQSERRPMLVVVDAPPPAWRVRLPDLRSRLAAGPVLRIEPPDDALMRTLIERSLERRQLFAGPDVTAWMADRIERSHVAITRLVDTLDDACHGRANRRLSIRAVREMLANSACLLDKDTMR